MLLRNPWWARPFEFFIRLFGLPGREGADPSMLLAAASPLLFGYMFGDVGQGAVLLAAGLLLHRRYPALRLLIPGGLAAMAFGALFGSVFAREDLVHPLWLAPLAQPLVVLAVPLYAGALLLTVGLALHALEAYWRHAFGAWVRCEAGLVAVYLGLICAPFDARGLWVALAGALAFVAGHALQARRARAAVGALGELAERTLQILVNTVSFARVGAFALAHAGLSAAVLALAHATGSVAGGLAVLVIGNAVVLVLEGLVVGIQTTRLILFEFFVRFIDSRGREFRPLLPPHPTEVHP
jgi:V/A-type H+-transporting ATPase subunit I